MCYTERPSSCCNVWLLFRVFPAFITYNKSYVDQLIHEKVQKFACSFRKCEQFK